MCLCSKPSRLFSFNPLPSGWHWSIWRHEKSKSWRQDLAEMIVNKVSDFPLWNGRDFPLFLLIGLLSKIEVFSFRHFQAFSSFFPISKTNRFFHRPHVLKDTRLHEITEQCNWALGEAGVVVVKWSAFSPSTPAIRVQILLKSTVFSVKLCLKRMKINKKRPMLCPFNKNERYVNWIFKVVRNCFLFSYFSSSLELMRCSWTNRQSYLFMAYYIW